MPPLKRTIICSGLLLLVCVSFFAQMNYLLNGRSVSLSPPREPQLTGNFNLKKVGQFLGATEVVDVFVQDEIALLADQQKGLLIINITNLQQPVLISTFQIGDNSVFDIVVEEHIAYVAHGRAGLRILDIANLTFPIEIGSYNNGGIAWKVFLTYPKLFLVDKAEGVEILDLSEITMPRRIGLYEGRPFDVFVRGGYAFVAGGTNKGLEIVDISDPSTPKKVGETQVNFEDSVGVYVSDDYAFVASKEHGLRIIKISRIRRPKVVATFDAIGEGKVWGIDGKGKFLYLACEVQGVQVIDISNVLTPHKVGEYSEYPFGKTFNVKSESPLLFMASFDQGLEILKWKSAPPNPEVYPYHQVSSAILNFNNSIGPFAIDAVLGNETLGLNLSLFMDIGLMSPVNITAAVPIRIGPGEERNVKINITAEESYYWGHFEGTMKLTTPLGSSELFSLADAGIPKHVKLRAFKTFIGNEIKLDSVIYPIVLWSQTFLNYSLSLVMSSYFNVSGSSIVTAHLNNSVSSFDLEWDRDGEELIIPIKIPDGQKDAHYLPLEDLQFEIDDLTLDLHYIRFDVLLSNLIPLYSWEINISHFNFLPTKGETPPVLLPTKQITNNTLFHLDGIYPLGNFVIVITFSGGIWLPPWAVFLTLFGIIVLLVIPWVLILFSSKKKDKKIDKSKSVVKKC